MKQNETKQQQLKKPKKQDRETKFLKKTKEKMAKPCWLYFQ